ncbi:hemicentin-1 [Elysia marginata]|uniref:Hemicentin-1 n=1 Tax=Elysia marginata TaxID=1093978 RepID=A0AAV4HGS7_9GAST|nr:hemicentin-1 [Elysia marginata]
MAFTVTLPLYGKHPFRKTPSSYKVTVGQTAVLRCAPTNLEGRMVIWKRVTDSEPLTVNLESFYNTDRIKAQHITQENQWNLVIEDVRPQDAGMYECQISSKQKNLREFFTLTVIGSEIEEETTLAAKEGIRVSGTKYAEKGERINLICNGTGQYHLPTAIDWFLNGNKLTSRGSKIKIKDNVDVRSNTVSSYLEVNDAQLTDGGRYVCRTSQLHIASFTVTVLNYEKDNKKRGTGFPEGPDSSSGHKRNPLRKDGFSSDDKNSAPARHTVSGTVSTWLFVSLVIGLLRHWLFPR